MPGLLDDLVVAWDGVRPPEEVSCGVRGYWNASPLKPPKPRRGFGDTASGGRSLGGRRHGGGPRVPHATHRPKRRSDRLDLHIVLRNPRNVTAELYRYLRDSILDGRLRANDTLPSSRELARQLQISRTTVVNVYERLCAEGFLVSRPGAGTAVENGIRTRTVQGGAHSPLRPVPVWESIPDGLDMAADSPRFDFRPGVPDGGRFPYAQWRARHSRQLTRAAVGSGAYIGAAGDPALRAAIARHIGVSRAVRAAPDEVIVTNGSQQAIDLIARVLLRPGDVVATEEPGYPLPQRLFRSHGCDVRGVPVDEEGLVVDALPAGAKLVYVTPSHQYPLGMALSMARRQALLDWADRADAAIIEDDYDSEFRYGGRPLEPLQTLDTTGRVLYVGSFSKVLLPALRLGFVVAPEPIAGALRKAKAVSDWHTAVPAQGAAARFIDDGLLGQHVRRMRRVYGQRHDRIVDILARDFGGLLRPLPATGGMHIAALFEDGVPRTDTEVTERARALDVAVLRLSRHYLAEPRRPGLMIGYGAIETDRIDEGLRRLRCCLAD